MKKISYFIGVVLILSAIFLFCVGIYFSNSASIVIKDFILTGSAGIEGAAKLYTQRIAFYIMSACIGFLLFVGLGLSSFFYWRSLRGKMTEWSTESIETRKQNKAKKTAAAKERHKKKLQARIKSMQDEIDEMND